jgi:hypothetical protein
MLVTVPYITPTFAHINTLFLQPTPWCARNCNGCYVKGFEQLQEIKTCNQSLFIEILNNINRKNNDTLLRANQVTLAVDKMPQGRTPVDRERRHIMMRVFNKFLEANRNSIGGQFHITVHTIFDLVEYVQLSGESSTLLDPCQLDMLSISHLLLNDIPSIAACKKLAKDINWNLTIDPSLNIDKIKQTFEQIAEAVDYVYLVLHKPNTGQFFDPNSFLLHQDFLRFTRTLPEHIQKKITIDGCITDSRTFLTTGFGCSSNVSRFQVWPDGSVTGCAYNQNRITNSAQAMSDLLENIYQVSKKYEFDKCKIPVHLEPKNKYVKRRTYSFLEIIE